MSNPIARIGIGVLALAALLGGGAATAAAHIQVSPTLAAPDDAVQFTVLVPGERSDEETTRVELKVPRGVLPYSFEAVPGWQRRLVKAGDGSIGKVVWTGRLAPDGFVALSFLAATPPQPGKLSWKALQFYSGGDLVRWIGSPSSEYPAAVTEVVAGAPLQNAGGEGASAASAATPVAASEDDDKGDDWLGRGLGLAALIVALAALAVALRRGRAS